MEDNPWNDDQIKAFYEHVIKSKDLLNISDDKLLQCWKYLQSVTSINSLALSSDSFGVLLSNPKVRSFCLAKTEYWSRLGIALLKVPSVNDASSVLAELVDRIIDIGSRSHGELLEKIWTKRDEIKLPLRTLEQIINAYPEFLEASLKSLLLTENDSLTTKILWSYPENAAIIKLSSQSADIFQAATSIMNEILIRSNLSPRIIDFVKTFIRGTKSIFKTNLSGFIELYPPEFQTLVMFLLFKKRTSGVPQNELEAFETVVNIKLREILQDNFKAFVCLVTHFPASTQSFQKHAQSFQKHSQIFNTL